MCVIKENVTPRIRSLSFFLSSFSFNLVHKYEKPKKKNGRLHLLRECFALLCSSIVVVRGVRLDVFVNLLLVLTART